MKTLNATYIFLFLAAICVCLAVYVQYVRRDRLSSTFVVANSSLATWNICIFLLENLIFPGFVNLISQIQLFSGMIFANGFYYFCSLYPLSGQSVKYRLNLVFFTVFTVAIFFTDYVTVATIGEGMAVFSDGVGYTLYSIYLTVLFLLMVYQLIKRYYRYELYRKRSVYLLVGILVFAPSAAFFDLILPMYGIYDYLFIGIVFFVVFLEQIIFNQSLHLAGTILSTNFLTQEKGNVLDRRYFLQCPPDFFNNGSDICCSLNILRET